MTSEAQKRATAKYQRENVRTFTLKFYPSQRAEWEHLRKQENKNGYLVGLIADDMEKR